MALPIIRLLGNKNINITSVFGISSKKSLYQSLISKSKFINQKIFFDESNYAIDLIQKLIQSARELDHKPVLFIASDTDLEIISGYRNYLSEYFLFSLPPDKIINGILNKDKFIELAAKLNLPIPKSVRISNISELSETNFNFIYPFIIKPSWRNNEWLRTFKEKKVFVINNKNELVQCIKSLKDFPSEYIVQELIAGPDSNIYCSFAILDRDSEPLSMGLCQKITQYPPQFGNTSIARPIIMEEISSLSKKIFKKLGLVGYASIEFKLDQRDNTFRIIEVTPNRFNRQFATTAIQRLNLPYALYRFETGLPVTNNLLKNSKKLWLSEVNEIRRIRFYKNKKLKEYFNLIINLLRVKVFEIFDIRDIKPFLFLLKTMETKNNSIN
ncbi:MAG: carboxylate--amine ligase [Ignavibacterium sp.]